MRPLLIIWGRRCLYGGYAFFFAFLLPIICWGGEGDPAHLHAGAHFIFVEPIVNQMPNTLERDHAPCLHPPSQHPLLSTLAPTHQEQEPSAQSTPAITLAQLLVLVAWSVLSLHINMASPTVKFVSALYPVFDPPPVPIPPPRLLSIVIQ